MKTITDILSTHMGHIFDMQGADQMRIVMTKNSYPLIKDLVDNDFHFDFVIRKNFSQYCYVLVYLNDSKKHNSIVQIKDDETLIESETFNFLSVIKFHLEIL